jgi:serine protease Do
VIIAIDGKPVDTDADLQRTILNYQPGETVTVTVMRYGDKKDIKVKLGEAPTGDQFASNERESSGPSSEPASTAKLGIAVAPMTPAMVQRDSIPDEFRGVVISNVDPRGPAFRSLARGWIITKVLAPGERRDIKSPQDLNKALAGLHQGDVVSLLVYLPRQARTTVVNVPIGD